MYQHETCDQLNIIFKGQSEIRKRLFKVNNVTTSNCMHEYIKPIRQIMYAVFKTLNLALKNIEEKNKL